MDNKQTLINRKHDLVDQHLTATIATAIATTTEFTTTDPHPNAPGRPAKKKRHISLRRPRNISSPVPIADTLSELGDNCDNSHLCSRSSSSASSCSVTTASSTTATAPETTDQEAFTVHSFDKVTRHDAQQDPRRTWAIPCPEARTCSTQDLSQQLERQSGDSALLVPDIKEQEERCLQENVVSAYAEEGESRRRRGSEDSRDRAESVQKFEQADEFAGRGDASPPALNSLDGNINDDNEDDDEEDMYEDAKSSLVTSSYVTMQAFDSQPDPSHDLDCDEDFEEQELEQEHEEEKDEDEIEGGEFPDIDEIQDWDMNEFQQDCSLSVDPVPENACPVCGLDLSKLNTMTPDAHVNRCLDGSGTDPVDTGSTGAEQSAAQSAALTTQPASSGNPLSAIIGTIRSVITNFPSRQGAAKIPAKPVQSQGKKGNSKYQKKPSRPCPFYKKMPDTSFTVDAFCYGAVEGCDAYFLSHFHSDHYGGLTTTWNHGLIYCSSITANLVISRLRVDPQYVVRLPMYVPTVVNGVTVRLMDANHCPGSVLFVFDLESPRRRYLHTGDFRACPDMCVDPILRQPENAPIDILYLDTTYSNPRYTFPSQDLVIREAANLVCRELGLHNNQILIPVAQPQRLVVTKTKVNIMESWLKKESGNSEKLLSMSIKTSQSVKAKQKWKEPMEKNRIVICVGTYLIGKERVFKAIAKAINSKVFVQHHKLQILAHLEDKELMDMLTSNRLEAQVHLMHMGSDMSPESLQEYLDALSPTFTRLIAIRPTGWTFTGGSKKYTPADAGSTDHLQSPTPTPSTLDLKPSFTSPTVKIYPVPYSEHSSFNELAGFVRSLNIHRIIPTVGVGSDKGRHAMTEWFKRWEDERRRGIGWD